MFYLGIDVSKAKLHACLLLDDEGKCKTKVVDNNAAGIVTLLAWTARQGVAAEQLHAVLEATGVYHESAAYMLFDAGVTVSIVNPAQAKDFARGLAVRTKNDGVDGLVLARFGALLKPKAWTPPAPEVRVLQALLARREALTQDQRREHNRREKALATTTPARILQSLDDTIAFLDQQLAQLQRDIDDPIDRHPKLKADLALLLSIPAVGQPVGSHLLVILQGHTFRSAEQLAAVWGWFRWNANPVPHSSDAPACPRPAPHESARCSIWQPSSLFATTPMSKRSMNGSWPVAKPKCPPSAPPCVNSSICVSVSSKPAYPTKPIMHFLLDRKDGIYAGRSP